MTRDSHGARGGDLDARLAALAERRPKLIDLGLSRVEATLEKLDNPQRRTQPTFHVAGTNGKGSTIAFLRAILEAADRSVHVYTSPHLVRFNERIVLAGEEIGDARLLDVLERVDAAAGDDPLSFFETLTCAALLAFSEASADFAIVEVGLGGRLDATNVLSPIAALIAPVALDHQDYLGDDIEAIAAEKAGILKPGAPAVIGPQDPAAMAVIAERAQAVGAPLYAFGADWDVYEENGRLVYQDREGLADLDPPRLPGRHQFFNAGLAIAGLRAVGQLSVGQVAMSKVTGAPALDDGVLSQGLRAATWPARVQRLTRGPVVERLSRGDDGVEVWLDGGHNPHAARALSAAMGDMEERAPKPLFLIVGMQANKDAGGFLAAFEGLASKVYAVAADHDGAAPAETIAQAAQGCGFPAESFPSLDAAADAVARTATAPFRALICGSLYLAGETLRDNG